MLNRCAVSTILALSIAAIRGCGAACAQDTVKIGMVMPMTGTAGDGGPAGGCRRPPVHQSARRHRRRQADRADRQGRRVLRRERQAAHSGAIVNDKVDIIGGGLTADLLGSAALITEAKKPTVIMLSSTTAVIEKSPYFVRTSCTLAQSSAIMADWAIQNGLEESRYPGDGFCSRPGGGDDLHQQLRRRRRPDRGSHSRPAAKPGLCSVPATRPRCGTAGLFVFIPSVQAATFAKQFVERGLDKAGIKLIGPGDLTDDERACRHGRRHAGRGNGAFLFRRASLGSQRTRRSRPNIKSRTTAGANFMAVSGYDGMHLIYEALKKTGGST